MDEWRQIAVYFYAATVAAALLIILAFFSFKLYHCGDQTSAGQYGNVCVSDDEEDIELEMQRYSDQLSEEEETKDDREIFVIEDEDDDNDDTK